MLNSYKMIGKIDLASNGQEALEKVMKYEGQYDIIFLDLEMPILNGYDACAKILELYLSTQIRKKTSKDDQKIKTGSKKSQNPEINKLCKIIDEYISQYYPTGIDKKIINDKRQTADKLILNAFKKVKYWCLDNLKRPYIFAYTQIINDETR